MDHRWEEAEARLLKQSLSRANKSKQAQRLNAVVCTGSTRCTVQKNCFDLWNIWWCSGCSADFLFKAAVVYFYHLMKGVVHTDEPMENYHPALKLLSWSWGFLLFFSLFYFEIPLCFTSCLSVFLCFWLLTASCQIISGFYPCLSHHPISLLFFTCCVLIKWSNFTSSASSVCIWVQFLMTLLHKRDSYPQFYMSYRHFQAIVQFSGPQQATKFCRKALQRESYLQGWN